MDATSEYRRASFQRSAKDMNKKYNKRNDPLWCMGVLMTSFGVLLTLFHFKSIISHVTKHPTSFLAVAFSLTGLLNLMFWRHKLKIMRGVEDIADTLNNASLSLDHLDRETKDFMSTENRKAEPEHAHDLVTRPKADDQARDA